MANLHINIDGKELESQPGETILNVAQRNGIDIPNLCYNDKISCTAACRLCIVNIEGRPGVQPSCAIKVEDGMKVTAFSESLEKQRKIILDLILSGHNDDCINCIQDSACQLQDLAFRYDMGREKRIFPTVWEDVKTSSDFSSQVLDYDATKCIQCQRCVKACYEIQGKGILTFENRGIKTVVSTGYDQWNESKCDGCGECAQNCPVGALTMKNVYQPQLKFREKHINKKIVTTCPYCGVGCQLEVSTINNAIVKVQGSDEFPNYGSTCVKGRFGLGYQGDKDRLKKPQIRKDGKLVEVEWEEALKYTADRLNKIIKEHGADAVAGLSSARCTNEDNFVFQKFMRTVIGTNNIDHCARLCHASTVTGLAVTFGSGAMTNPISDFEKADVIIVTGSNTTEAHPVLANAIKRAVLFNNAKLIVIDPRKIDLVRYAAVWLRQKGGSDLAWANGFANVILNNNLQNSEFINDRTEGFEDYKNSVKKYTPEYVEKITGIPAEDLIKAAKIYGKAERGSIAWTMGITQSSHGTDNVKAMSNLAMLTGNVGREGTGTNPLRGQNNVQGACDMGALPTDFPGYQKVADPNVMNKFETAWKCTLPKNPGLTLMEMMNAAHDKKIKAMYIMGENPVLSDANVNHVREALKNLEFLVCQDIFPSETTDFADVILPAKSSLEKYGTFTNTERRVLPVREIIKPIDSIKDDWAILDNVATEMGKGFNYSFWTDIMDEINLLTPSYTGITKDRILSGEKLAWPCPDTNHKGTPVLHIGKFTRGKGLFFVTEHVEPGESADSEFPFIMNTGRIIFHYHTGTMSRRSKSLNDFVLEPYFEMNSKDMARLNILNGEKVKVYSRRGEIVLAAKHSDKVAENNIFIPFHFAEAAANRLTNDLLDPIAKIPEFKVSAVNIVKL